MASVTGAPSADVVATGPASVTGAPSAGVVTTGPALVTGAPSAGVVATGPALVTGAPSADVVTSGKSAASSAVVTIGPSVIEALPTTDVEMKDVETIATGPLIETKDVVMATGAPTASSTVKPLVVETKDVVMATGAPVALSTAGLGPLVVEAKEENASRMSDSAFAGDAMAEAEYAMSSGPGVVNAVVVMESAATSAPALKREASAKIVVDDISLPPFQEPEFEECIRMLDTLTDEQQRALKGLLGTAIGDSVGLPFELGAHVKNRKRLDQIVSWKSAPHKLERVRVQEFLMFVYGERMSRAEGTPFGRTYSDDTVCTDLKMQAVAAAWKELELSKDIGIEVANKQLFAEVMGQYLVWAHGSDGQLFQGYGRFTEDLLRAKEGDKSNALGDLQRKLQKEGNVLWHASAAGTKINPSWQYLEWVNSYFGGEAGDASGGGSWGNGAVMSFTPGVILSRSAHAGVLAEAAPELARTHRHRTANIGATLLAELLEQIHAGNVANCSELQKAVLSCPSWKTAVEPLMTDPSSYMHPVSAFAAFLNDFGFDVQLAAANEFVQSLNGTCAVSGDHRFGPLGEAFRIASNMDDNMGERLTVKGNPDELVRFSQRGLNSVFIAIWCAVGATNCWDWLEKILYVGGDSDTVGAVAGQIACPLLDAGEVSASFKTFVAAEDSFLSVLHRTCNVSARRYFHRAMLFAAGRWTDLLNVPRLVDPYYEGVTEKWGVRLLGVQRGQCTHGETCTNRGLLHRDRFAHHGDADYELSFCPPVKRPGSSAGKKETDGLRIRCKHGTRCFDTSRRHREQFAHPGDPDFEFSVVSGSAGPRKRKPCRHGGRCWDKSRSHREEYAHPGDPDF